MPFHSTGPHWCPNCPAEIIGKNKDRRCGVRLELCESNYSGCGVDIARCPRCKKDFQISYKVAEVTEVKSQ
jgi:hypothetical protein